MSFFNEFYILTYKRITPLKKFKLNTNNVNLYWDKIRETIQKNTEEITYYFLK